MLRRSKRMWKTADLLKSALTCLAVLICLSQVRPAQAEDARMRISSILADAPGTESVEAEIVFGRELAARILGVYGYDDDASLNRYVNLVGSSVALYAGRPELVFHFAVLDSEAVNAFATPGGYVFITRAAILKMQNEAQLAGVLGHEIAHVTERHMLREINIAGHDGAAISGLVNLIGGATGGAVKSLEQAMDNAAAILFERGYKVEDEIEADKIGMLMAAAAGYDPSALATFLSHVKRFEKEDPAYTGDHPMHVTRIAEMQSVLTANSMTHMKSITAAERFYENVR